LQISSDIILQARRCAEELKTALANMSETSSTQSPHVTAVSNKAKALILHLQAAIENTTDPVRLHELIGTNDDLTSYTAQIPEPGRPVLKLPGLGRTDLTSSGQSNPAEPGINGIMSGNGEALHDSPVEETQEHTPTTPRIDKGKAKAQPEPEEQEKILSPNFLITESSESEDEDGPKLIVDGDDDVIERPSPIDRSAA
jgi:protein phosphatase 1 regulatory subunit 37